MPSVAIIGTRGYPSYYGGFETLVRKLAPYLADMGWDVTVYGRAGQIRLDEPSIDARVNTRISRAVDTKSLSTLSSGLTSSVDAARRRPDVALVMNVANGYFLPLLAARGIPRIVNVDGIEWERAKWSKLAKRVFRVGANVTARWASGLIFDARAIETYWRDTFDSQGTFIPYGGDVASTLPIPRGLEHRGYVLMVARFVPENSVPEFFQAVPKIAEKHPVVIVGSSGYGGPLEAEAAKLVSDYPSVSWLGHVSDDALLLSLWQHAGVYFHGHSVGGTNPALVQAMAAGAPILALDTVYNREVLGPGAICVSADPDSIATKILGLLENTGRLEEVGQSNLLRAETEYSWKDVCDSYERMLRAHLYG